MLAVGLRRWQGRHPPLADAQYSKHPSRWHTVTYAAARDVSLATRPL